LDKSLSVEHVWNVHRMVRKKSSSAACWCLKSSQDCISRTAIWN